MTIQRIDPDEAFTINGVQVTGRTLAEARQELSHRGVYNPRWVELTEQEQGTAALSAGAWLRALADLVPTAGDVSGYTCDGCQEQADYWDEDGAPRCNRCKAFDKATASESERAPNPLIACALCGQPLADDNCPDDCPCATAPYSSGGEPRA